MTELQTLPNITFWSKSELRTCRSSQKTEQFVNIKLFIPRLSYLTYAHPIRNDKYGPKNVHDKGLAMHGLVHESLFVYRILVFTYNERDHFYSQTFP